MTEEVENVGMRVVSVVRGPDGDGRMVVVLKDVPEVVPVVSDMEEIESVDGKCVVK